MAKILQGTTPSITFTPPTSRVDLDDVTQIEFNVIYGGENHLYYIDALTVDTESNSVSHRMTEAETFALEQGDTVTAQCRFMDENGNIVGTQAEDFTVAKLYSTTPMPGVSEG